MQAVVSLGSNIEPRADYLARALAALAALPGTRLERASEPEETEPVGVPPEYAHLKFLNQLAVFETELEVHEFSRRMHAIEDALGRNFSLQYADIYPYYSNRDFTNENQPQIHVRTWQPDKVGGKPLPKDEVFTLGDFDI